MVRGGSRACAGIHGPYALPEVAVEVRSPSTWRYNVGRKKDHYERRGLNEL